MYILKTESSFDSAHFLSGYEGKCSNLHGHRWRIVLEVMTETLSTDKQHNGMYVDFGDLKRDLKAKADELDHCMIIEKGSLKEYLNLTSGRPLKIWLNISMTKWENAVIT